MRTWTSRALECRKKGDTKGFNAHIGSLERELFQYELSVRDHQDALISMQQDLDHIESQYRFRNRVLRDLFVRRSLIRESEYCMGQIDVNNRHLVKLDVAMKELATHIRQEQEVFYDNAFARNVAKEHPAVYDRFFKRKRA